MRFSDIYSIARDTATRTFRDRGLPYASEAAFAFAFSLFPLVFLIATVTGLLVREEGLRMKLLELLANFMPVETLTNVSGYLMSLQETDYLGSQLIFSLLLGLWTSTGVIVVWGEAIGRAYRVNIPVGFWRRRLRAVAVLLIVGVLIAVSFTFLVIAPVIAKFLTKQLGVGSYVITLLEKVGFPLAVLCMSPAYATLYWMGPARQPGKREYVWPGAILATWVWVIVTYIFRIYIVNFGSYNETYGSLAAFMILLMWMYSTSLTVIVGAEFNVVLGKWMRRRNGQPKKAKPRETKHISA
jgi:membrane protein